MRVRMNEAIEEESVLLYGDDGTLEEVATADALELARSRAMDLVEEWEPPRPQPARGSVVCRLLDVPKPVVWELVPEPGAEPELDLALWFHSEGCAERHYLIGNPHTFPGRISAWCPRKMMSYCVSKSEIAECSTETAYFVKGFLSGSEPRAPVDEAGDRMPPSDLEYRAWARATQLFQQTGTWNSRFRICEVCGARLLPSNPRATCWGEHIPR